MSIYNKKNWENNKTPLNADNLNHIENGIYDNSVGLDNLNKEIIRINGDRIMIGAKCLQNRTQVLALLDKLDERQFNKITEDFVSVIGGPIIVNVSSPDLEYPAIFNLYINALSIYPTEEGGVRLFVFGDLMRPELENGIQSNTIYQIYADDNSDGLFQGEMIAGLESITIQNFKTNVADGPYLELYFGEMLPPVSE